MATPLIRELDSRHAGELAHAPGDVAWHALTSASFRDLTAPAAGVLAAALPWVACVVDARGCAGDVSVAYCAATDVGTHRLVVPAGTVSSLALRGIATSTGLDTTTVSVMLANGADTVRVGGRFGPAA